jgi:CP family cyanate transporter-like MFS transporter
VEVPVAIAAERPSSYRFLVEALLFLTYAAFGLSWIAITPLMGDLQAAFHISGAQLGLISAVVSVAKVIAPLLTGMLAVRLGLKRTLMVGSLFICVAAFAPFAPDFKWFLASRFLFGVGGAVVVTLMGPMVMQWFPKSELPIVNAFNNVAVNTGITITLFATAPLAAHIGWQHTLVAYGLVSATLALAWALLGREREVAPVAGAAPEADVRYMDVWRMRETWLIALCFAGPLALYLAFNTWLPKHYMEAYHMTKAAASQYTGLFNLVGIPSAIAAGFLTRSLGLRRPFIIASGIGMGIAAFGMFLAPTPPLLLASAVLLGISLFAYVAPLFTIPMELPGMTPRHVSLMMGTVYSFAYLFSSLSPVVVGWLHDATGSFVPGLSIWAGFSFVLALGGLLLPETGPKGRKQSPPDAPVALDEAAIELAGAR